MHFMNSFMWSHDSLSERFYGDEDTDRLRLAGFSINFVEEQMMK